MTDKTVVTELLRDEYEVLSAMHADILDPAKVPDRLKPMIAAGYRELAAYNRRLYAESLNGRRPYEPYRKNAELYESYVADLERGRPVLFGRPAWIS